MVWVIFSFCRISAYVDAMRGKWNWKTRLSTFWQNLEMEIGKYKFPLLFCGIPECIWCASSGRVILTLLHPHQSPNIHQFQTRVTFIPALEPEMNDTVRVRRSRWTRLQTCLLKAWLPNPLCQLWAENINYHTNPLPFQSQIVIVVSIKDSEASFSLTESLPSERVHAQHQNR